MVRAATGEGHRVTPLDREGLDITRREEALRVITGAAPELVVNCAAFSNVDAARAEPREALLVNRDGAGNVALAAAEAGAGVVHISTDYVFDGKKSSPYTPQDQPAPLSLYGISKLAGEMAVLETNPRALIVRTSWIFGGAEKGFVAWVRRQLSQEGPALRIVQDERSRPTYAADLAPALLRLGEVGASGVLHLANAGHCTRLELAEEVRGILGSGQERAGPGLAGAGPGPRGAGPGPTAAGLNREFHGVNSEAFGAPARRPLFSVLDLTEAEKILGGPLPSWQESLRRYLSV